MENIDTTGFKYFKKKPGHYSTKDWQAIIDSTWGEGLPTEQKLSVFDQYWNKVDQTWGGFPNLVVNWDSLRDYYRPIVAAGVSRGRFYGILCRLTRALCEWHVYIRDPGIDQSMFLFDDEYSNYPSINYKPGLPLLILGTDFRTNFGAGLTSLPDNTALVYSVMENHPLKLEPGDIILGYDGKPWKQNLQELLEMNFPILLGGRGYASSTKSASYVSTECLGLNWGLFDTIDVVKYSSKDIVHFPTTLLNSIKRPYFKTTEKLPIKGVPFPDLKNNELVSWGIVDGTDVGYINALNWLGAPDGQIRELFGQAVRDLVNNRDVKGLILDFRNNIGGSPEYANLGFEYLFNQDPTSYESQAIRIKGDDHFAFDLKPARSTEFFTPTSKLFDHPIAVLTRPNCGSAADYNVFRLRFHPMVRFFGKTTAAAYTDFYPANFYPIFNINYYQCRVDNGALYSNYNNEGHLIHKGFPVDEEVWLTQEGVANGRDDVVKSALAWIKNLVYGHDLTKNISYCRPGIDTLKISALVENPNSHQISSMVYIENLESSFIDSVELYKTGVSGNSEIWTGNCLVADTEAIFSLILSVKDITESKIWTTDNISRVTTIDPSTVDSIGYKIYNGSGLVNIRPFVHNGDKTKTIKNASIKIISIDSCSYGQGILNLPDIPPDSTVGTFSQLCVSYDDLKFPGYFNFKLEIMSDGWVYWTDSIRLTISTVEIVEQANQPLTFNLHQNYPNPFNPTTKIKYQISTESLTSLKVYDILGKEVVILVNEKKQPGVYEVNFNAISLSSGIYFYKLQSGSFIETKKMMLLK